MESMFNNPNVPEQKSEDLLWERAALAALQGFCACHGKTDWIDTSTKYAIDTADSFINRIRARQNDNS